jgi:tetratricopeptide (TPR) repeat protein
MRAIKLDPTNCDTCGNIGDILQARVLHEEALSWYERSLEIRPDAAKTMANRAISLADLYRFDEAMAAYRRSIIVDPNQPIAAWNLSLLQSLSGDFQAGWRGREARFAIPVLAAGYPKWSTKRLGNEAVAGKTVIVCADEGMGDSIQFVRYVPMLAALGARVILIANDRNRSTPLRTLTRILDVDATFVSLQKSPGPEDLLTLSDNTDIIDVTSDLIDFAETAALVACLDLVITVDTSVAHLSAALGCPTWILLPYVPDWRWLLDREDSPWYPTVRLFRQTETRDYETVLGRVRTELVTLIGAKS